LPRSAYSIPRPSWPLQTAAPNGLPTKSLQSVLTYFATSCSDTPLSVASGVLMSRFLPLRDPAAVERLKAEIETITHRPDGEKLALNMLRRGNDMARAAVAIGTEIGWPQPAKRDWRILLACGLIKSDRFLVLTARGLMWQQRIAVPLVRAAGLHFLLPSTDS